MNEQPYEYWRDLFVERNYRLFDWLRPQLQQRLEVESWYRYNSLLFIHDAGIAGLPSAIAATRLADDQPVPDLAPFGNRLLKAVMRRLSPATLSRLAVIKHALVNRLNRLKE